MECPNCGHRNRAAARFCGECAAPLGETIDCPSCGTANPTGQRFCNECGERLEGAETAAAPAEGPPIPSAPAAATAPIVARDPRSRAPDYLREKMRAGGRALEGERKQVTVLFADVMGSMELAERTDPEEWRRIMERFFAILCDGVHRFEGTVDKFTGDGIMALFGAPIAHEDHARRACFAALHLKDELDGYAGELRRTKGLNFSVRMGLNSGEVVVGGIGDDLEMSYTAVGHTVGLAQRMEQLAEPGKAYLTEDTRRLVEGYLQLRDLGQFEVKGASEPLGVFELAGVGAARGRLDVSRARGFSRFVGRDDEMAILESALEESLAGNAQAIGIVGEAGVGKSRLCHEFAQRCRARGISVYQAAGQAHGKSIPFLAALEMLRGYFGIIAEDSDQSAREKIAGRLLLLDQEFADDLPLVFDFLAIPDPGRPVPTLNPEARQRQLFDLIKRLVHAATEKEQAINLFEDLHWIDPGSDIFLAQVIESLPGSRGMTVVNFRPEYRAEWMEKPYYRQLDLVPLGPEAIEEMLADLLGTDPSLNGLPELIRERTGGNPFFTEEVVQTLIESGTLEGERGAYRLARPIDEVAMPASVQSVLAARIDRLGEREKAVLQSAAVIGKEFTQPVLQRVMDLPEDEVEAGLRELVEAEFLYQQALYPEPEYAFVHPLTQEVAYGSQLAERRREAHAAVATVIEELNPDRLDEQAALVAQHWEQAGDTTQAARWHARAAAWAGTNDPREAVRHWHKVRELSDSLPESPETLALGTTARVWILQFGWRLGIAGDEAASLFAEGEAMANRAGDIRSRAFLLATYGVVKGLEGDLERYAELAMQSLSLAEEAQDPALHIGIAPAPAYAMFTLGRYQDAFDVMERALSAAGDDHTLGAGISVKCPYGWCVSFEGVVLANMGQIEEARRLVERGMEISREQEDFETVGWSHANHVWIAHLSGHPAAALGHAQRALEIAERIGDAFSRTLARFWIGLAHHAREEWQQAIDAFEESTRMAKKHRTNIENEPWRQAWLAESYLGLGDVKRSLKVAREAVELARGRRQTHMVIATSISLARALLASEGPGARPQIDAALREAEASIEETGASSEEPRVHEVRAELAKASGEEEAYERELRETQRLYEEIGADGRADALEQRLAALA